MKAVLRPERNQQIMCQSNMAHSILRVGMTVFKSEKHLLLAPFYYIMERLSSHAITPSDLRLAYRFYKVIETFIKILSFQLWSFVFHLKLFRTFLRLDMPLCCRNLEEIENEEPIRDGEGGSIPIARYFVFCHICPLNFYNH